MLRHLKVKNFVFFKEENSIDFQPGSNFFIGQNNSGKSSIIEAIRRCMSPSKNTSLSQPFDTSSPSTVVAFFYLPEDIPTSKRTLVSSIVRMPDNDPEVDIPVGVKIVYFENDISSLEMDFVRGDPKRHKHQQIDLTEIERQLIYESIPKGSQNDFKTDAFAESILQKFMYKKRTDFVKMEVPDEDTMPRQTKCEKILTTHVDKYTVCMFSLRGIGSMQWTNSKKISREYRKRNADEIQEQVEIMTWYFDYVDEIEKEQVKKQEKEQVKEQVKRYFDIITGNSEVDFERVNGKIRIKNRMAGKRKFAEENREDLALFKVPYGLFEAKNCAIMLSMKLFKTIAIEEPERGMHPQMIERLRDLILQRITDKTIILTSHHPAILAPWTIPRIQFFRRKETEHEHTNEIIPGTVIERYEGKEITEKKTPRLVTSDHFASMFFAKRVLLLEGETDFLFVTSIKTLLLDDAEIIKRMMQPDKECTNQNTTRFDAFLCSLHIVDMKGKENTVRLMRICKALHIEYYLLLDFDGILKPKPNPPEQKGKTDAKETGPDTADKFLEECALSGKYTASEVEGNVQKLEEDRIFVWKKNANDEKGELEDVIIALCKDPEERRNFLKANNVNLMFDRKAGASKKKGKQKTKSRNKLFGDQQVTSENISNVVRKLIEYEEQDMENTKTRGMEGVEHKPGPSGGREQQILRFLRFLYKHANS